MPDTSITTFRQRIVRALWRPSDDPGPAPIDPTSSESVKRLFDAVRNFALTVAIAYGGAQLSASADRMADAVGEYFFRVSGWIAYSIALGMFILNTFFLQDLLERYPISKPWRTVPFALAISLGANLLACLLVAAFWFARPLWRDEQPLSGRRRRSG